MDKRRIAKLDKFVAENPGIQKIHVNVSIVYRANFNDDRLIESREFSVEELKDKPLEWFDLYLGRKKDNKIKLAFVYLKDRTFYLLEAVEGETKLVKREGFSVIYTDDYDENHIIATEIW